MLKLHRRAYVQHPISVSARYTYSPLKDDEIRVIWLEKGSFSSEIVIRLEVRKRTTDDPYEAVSYAWGNKLEMGTIKVHVQGTTDSYSDLQVRDNVVTMLRHLRARPRRLPLWIDAICINQAMKKEKAVQVQLMGDVYRGANRTLVWLGHAETTLLR
ncbi:HET-domain-containing protein, partial [Lizonia empirigonia]